MLTNLPDRTYRIAVHCIMGLLAILVLFTFCNYGITWDEEPQSNYGIAVLDYYLSGFQNKHHKEIYNLFLYGGLFDGIAAVFNEFTPTNIYDTRHFLNAILGLIGLWGTWKLGRLMGGGFVGLCSLLLLVLTPMYYGHMYNNPKDIPFAAGVVWTLYYMSKTLFAYPTIRRSLIIKLGVILGLTLGVRVNGIMVLGHWGLIFTGLACLAIPKWDRINVRNAFFATGRVILPVVLIAYAVMLLCWPWAQERPIENPIRAIMEFSNFPQIVEVLLNGSVFLSTQLPWYYVPLYFLIQMPILHLGLMFFGIFLIVDIYMKLNTRGRRASVILMLVTIIFPIAYALFSRPALYDAVRHFIFILPPMCILMALVLKRLTRAALEDTEPGTTPLIKIVFSTLILVLALMPVYTMTRLHPYEYIYINELFGGVEGGHNKYELDYWAASFKQASEELEQYAQKRDPDFKNRQYKIAICGPWATATVFFPPNFEPVYANLEADFFLSTTRWQCQDMRQGHEIISVSRYGVPLSIVKDVKDFPTPP